MAPVPLGRARRVPEPAATQCSSLKSSADAITTLTPAQLQQVLDLAEVGFGRRTAAQLVAIHIRQIPRGALRGRQAQGTVLQGSAAGRIPRPATPTSRPVAARRNPTQRRDLCPWHSLHSLPYSERQQLASTDRSNQTLAISVTSRKGMTRMRDDRSLAGSLAIDTAISASRDSEKGMRDLARSSE